MQDLAKLVVAQHRRSLVVKMPPHLVLRHGTPFIIDIVISGLTVMVGDPDVADIMTAGAGRTAVHHHGVEGVFRVALSALFGAPLREA